jgi:hypothetical protein
VKGKSRGGDFSFKIGAKNGLYLGKMPQDVQSKERSGKNCGDDLHISKPDVWEKSAEIGQIQSKSDRTLCGLRDSQFALRFTFLCM